MSGPAAADVTSAGAPGAGRARPGGRRGWIALAVLLAVAVVLLVLAGLGAGGGGVPLSTTSVAGDGSRALARLLAGRGTTVTATDALTDASGGPAGRTVVVVDPAAYAADQLRHAAASAAGTLVLLQPADDALDAVGVRASVDPQAAPGTGAAAPDCDLPAAVAAGPVRFAGATRYRTGTTSVTRCYDGRLLRSGSVVVWGDAGLLTNDHLADPGAAALALDVLGTSGDVLWVQPGADAAGPTGSIWDALPPHAGTAAAWLLAVGVLLVLWRGRRLGAPVREPLPVVVRAAEVVHGRARLWARAGAVGPAAAVLRRATTARLRRRLGLPAAAPVPDVVRAADARLRRHGEGVPSGLLDGPPPADDDALAALAAALRDLETRLDRDGRAG